MALESASNRNEYQDNLGGKGGGA